jgi:L-fuconate dehydratase
MDCLLRLRETLCHPQVCHAIAVIANKLIGRDPEELFKSMGKTWDWLSSDPQLRWIGPEKGVIHIAVAAVNNALWDMFARARGKPLWKLVVDMTPEELVDATAFRYITDAITRDEAIALLKAKEAGKRDRETTVRELGYPAYVTSVGWLGTMDNLAKRSSIDPSINI